MSVDGLQAIHRAVTADRTRHARERLADLVYAAGIVLFDLGVLSILGGLAVAVVGYLASFFV